MAVSPVLWRRDEMPTRETFAAAVEARYEMIELPWFPDSATVWVETSEGLVEVGVQDAVAPPAEIAQALWVGLTTHIGGF